MVSLTVNEELYWVMFCCSYQGYNGDKEVDDGRNVAQHPTLLLLVTAEKESTLSGERDL